MNKDIETVTELTQHGFTSTVINNGGGIYNNGDIAITKDLIFGLSVWDGDNWFPLSSAEDHELSMIKKLINDDPLFLWKDDLDKLINS